MILYIDKNSAYKIQQFYEFVDSCYQVTIHFADLMSFKFSRKTENAKIAKFMCVKVCVVHVIDCRLIKSKHKAAKYM